MANLFEIFPSLSLPPIENLQVKGDGESLKIYDPLRSKWIALTPEEWVRQHFTSFLVNKLGYPASRTANEVSLTQINRKRRADTIIYDNQGLPYIVVEYKRPSVEITPKVFDQIARYNSVLHAPFLIVSNGLRHFCCRYNSDGSYTFIPDIPPHSPA